MNKQSNKRPPDPRDYDMYSAFRTKERGDARRQAQQRQKSSYFDAYAHRAEEEQNARKEARRRQAQAAAQNRQRSAQAQAPNAQNGQNRITYGQGLTNQSRPRIRTEVPLPGEAPMPRRSRNADQTYGTRVQNDGENAYRYGYHSSYRTADGRILDGFDASGRPIYRDASSNGGASIIQRTEYAPEAAPTYRAPRRIHVETLADTDAKPFPFRIVLTVVFCTALVMAVLFAYMRLNEYTNTLSYLTYRLSNLRSEANALQAELVRREDLLTIEQTASEILGMVKTDVLTKKYVTIENEDKTEVVSKLEEEARKHTSIEIDLDTGKPIGKQNVGNGYIPPTPTTEAPTEITAEPVTEVPEETAAESDSDESTAKQPEENS